MIKTRNKVTSILLIILFLLPFMYFPGYILYGLPQKIFKIYTFTIYILITIIYFKKNNFKIPTITIIILILQGIPTISTYLNDKTQFGFALKMLFGFLCASLLIEYNIKNNKKNFLQALSILFGTMVFINILTFFIYFPSMDPTQLNFYFLGNDNGSIYETILYIYITLIYYMTYYKKIPKYFYIILLYIFSGYYYVKSGNGIVCILLTMIFIILYENKSLKRITNSQLFWIIYIFFFLNIVILRHNNILVKWILKVLEKSETFSGRTLIWDNCLYHIKKHPIMGNGYESIALSTSKIGKNKAHNIILQYLYNGGYAMLGTFLTFLFILIKKIRKSSLNSNIKNCMLFSIYLFFIISIFDYYTNKFTFIIMIMTYYVMAIYDKEKQNE